MIESDVAATRSADATTVVEGDRVRLKFLYPNGTMEVLDCRWIAATTLGAPESPSGGWVVVSADDRVLWKPLSHLIQIEVLEPNEEARQPRRSSGTGFEHYR